jgi:hypothetical protein
MGDSDSRMVALMTAPKEGCAIPWLASLILYVSSVVRQSTEIIRFVVTNYFKASVSLCMSHIGFVLMLVVSSRKHAPDISTLLWGASSIERPVI